MSISIDGDKAKAKELSDQGKEEGVKMVEANKKAAEFILKHRNDSHGPLYLDLHGLLLDEAMAATLKKLEELRLSKDDVVLELIPGAGHHSKDKAVIKPAVIEELKKQKLEFEEKNAGTLLVTVPGGGGAAAATTTTATAAVSGLTPVEVDSKSEATAGPIASAVGTKKSEQKTTETTDSCCGCVVM